MGILTKATSGLAQWIGRSIGLGDASFWRYYFGGDNPSGKTVTAQTALQLSTAWACIRLISQLVSTLPLFLYRRDASGNPTLAKDHELYVLLHDQPNANMTAAEFWECMVACLCLWGNAYAMKVRTSDGRLIALEPLRPEFMVVKLDVYGAVWFHYTDVRGVRHELGEADVFHLKGFTLDGLIGLSPISYARNTLGMAAAQEETAGKIFASGLRPSGVVTTDQILNAKNREEIRESVVKQVAGSGRAGGTVVLEAGMKYQAITMNPEDAQLLQSRAHSIEEMCRWFHNVPPVLIGHSPQGQTMFGTGVEQIMLGWLTLGLGPLLAKIEQSIRKGLLTPAERRIYYAKFAIQGLMRADAAGRAALYSSYVQNGVKNRNEVRELEEDAPFDGGEVFTVQSNLTPINKLGEQSSADQAKGAMKSWLGLPSFGDSNET